MPRRPLRELALRPLLKSAKLTKDGLHSAVSESATSGEASATSAASSATSAASSVASAASSSASSIASACVSVTPYPRSIN